MAFKVHVNEIQRFAATHPLFCQPALLCYQYSAGVCPWLLYMCACIEHHHSLPWVWLYSIIIMQSKRRLTQQQALKNEVSTLAS